MSGLILGAIVLLAVAVAVITTLIPAIVGLRRHGLGEAAAAARRRSVYASAAAGGTGALVFAAWLALGPDNVTRSLPVLPSIVGIAMTAVAVVAERTWPRPTGDVRVASLRAATGPSGNGARLALGGALLSLIVLAIGAVTDNADGRMAELTWGSGGSGHGPYPGSFYTVPIITAGIILAALTWWGLREVEGRPALGPGIEDVDAAARAASRVRVLRGATFASLVTSGALLTTMALAWASLMRNVADVAPAGQFDAWWWTALQWGSLVFIVVGLALILMGIRALVTPGPAMPTGSPMNPADADRAPATT